MDSAKQAAGEKRVRDVLIGGLYRRGLMRPAGQSGQQFEEMVADICARLAYMSAPALMALEEQCAAHPGGRSQDRFPIGAQILKWAAAIEPPPDSASPLIRAVFAHAIGRAALDEGWAPELLEHLRRHRAWPTPYVLSSLREAGDGPARQMARIEDELARHGECSPTASAWRDRRLAMIRKCEGIAAGAAS